MSKSGSRYTPLLKQCFVTAAVSSNIIGQGCTMGYTGVLLPQLHQPGSLIPIDKDDDSWITSVSALPVLIGNFIVPSVMDRLGRRTAHLAAAAPALLGWFTIVLATSLPAIIIGRILLGFSFGMLLPLRSILIGEYTSPKNRGAFLTTISFAQAFGIFFVHLIGSLLPWQQTAIICVFFPFTSFVMTLYTPESPSYLAVKGAHDECSRAFRWLRGFDEEEELQKLLQVTGGNNKGKVSFKQMIGSMKKKECYKPIVLMIHVYAMMHFAGGPTIAAYGTIIIGSILGPGADANFWLVFVDAQRLISNFVAIYLVKVCRRRVVMNSTAVLCILSHIAIAGYVYGKINGFVNYNAIWVPIILINLQFFSVATGMATLPFVIAGEVFPLQYRSIGGSISMVSVAVFGFLVLKTFPGLMGSIGIQGTYLIYAGVMTYFLLVIWILLPETKGKTLQQIEEEFSGRPLMPEVEAIQSLQKDDKELSERDGELLTKQSKISENE